MIGRIIIAVVFSLSLSALSLNSVCAEDHPLVRVGVLANQGPEQCLQRWTPLAEYLTVQIPEKKFLIIPLAFADVPTSVGNGDVDFILATSSSYVELERLYGANRIATLKNRVLDRVYTEFGGVLFCRADRKNIRHVKDLKGKTFVAVDEASFGGWIAVWRELKQRGIDPSVDFKKLTFGGTHGAVVYAVQNGKADAGAVRTDTLEKMAAEGKIGLQDFYVLDDHGHGGQNFPLFLSTRLYPEWPMAKVKHTPDNIAEKVAVALIQMPEQSAAATAGKCAGWTIPLDYQPVHECLRELRICPYKDLGKLPVRDVVKKYRSWVLIFVTTFLFLGVFTIVIFRLHQNLRLTHKELEKEVFERKQADDEARKGAVKYRSLFESTPDAIFLATRDGFLDCNTAALKIFGYPAKNEFLTRSVVDLSPHNQADGKESRAAASEYMHKALREGSAFFEWIHKKKDGTLFPTEVMLNKVDFSGKEILQALIRDVSKRKQVEDERESLIVELKNALAQVKTLTGLLPICAQCKKVRDDTGYWNQIENFIRDHTEADFSHSICPDCARKLYPELYDDDT
ncbi:MAG: PhnD/SsuA/transferrin family substrate-binding protein [Deltaproteobacteria bacterium]|nr:PhnD/SsuA/transferrin family substrate-binding protein [Deltaproteobacteria bacterium]